MFDGKAVEKKDAKDQAEKAIRDSGGSEACVTIATASSVKEMILPGAFAILSPAAVGLLIGPACLAGVLAGSIASGCERPGRPTPTLPPPARWMPHPRTRTPWEKHTHARFQSRRN